MRQTVNDSRDKVADELEIRDLAHRYADASSRRDSAGVASVFTSGAEWTSAAVGQFHGRDALEAFFTEMLGDWNAFFQALLSGVVVFDAADPDGARGRWFVQETGQRSEGANLIVSGVYHDEYVRDAGTWRINRRQYDPLLIRADDSVTALPYPIDVPAIE
jgi:ketosteroid isomerase-like protein